MSNHSDVCGPQAFGAVCASKTRHSKLGMRVELRVSGSTNCARAKGVATSVTRDYDAGLGGHGNSV